MRVVSLLPGATEIVAALGAGGMLVGVSHRCDYPPEVLALPRVTRTHIDSTLPSGAIDRAVTDAQRARLPPVELDVPLVAQLRPDVVIGQGVCQVCAIGDEELARLVATLIPTPWVVTLHAHMLDGVLEDVRRIGEALGLPDEAEELIAGLRYRLERLRRAAPRPRRPRVLVLEWLDPPYVAGHWVPELVAIAGGEDVGNAPGEPSRTRTWSELVALAPDLVVVAPCGFDESRARAELAAVSDRDARALLGRHVEFLDGNAYTSRPGPRLVDAVEILRRLMRSSSG